ncbi:hypothetical protein RYX36_023390, partial [Vicia faba]
AIANSVVSWEDVNYINAHATSTPVGDLKEYQALIHLLGAAGGVEAVATIQGEGQTLATTSCWEQ